MHSTLYMDLVYFWSFTKNVCVKRRRVFLFSTCSNVSHTKILASMFGIGMKICKHNHWIYAGSTCIGDWAAVLKLYWRYLMLLVSYVWNGWVDWTEGWAVDRMYKWNFSNSMKTCARGARWPRSLCVCMCN